MKTYLIFFILCWCFNTNAQFKLAVDSLKVGSLNTINNAEAYPFISNDGLRLYYTSSQEGLGRIFISERKAREENFLSSRPVSENLPDNFFGATLTDDELSIYLFNALKSYYSIRASKKDDFSFPMLIKELGNCHTKPAISPNGEELIAVHGSGCDTSRKSRDTIRLFVRNSDGIFQRKDILHYPEDFRPGPGQFSKDGLNYYTTVDKRWYDYNKGWQDSILSLKYSRASLKSPFLKYEIIFSEFKQGRPEHITFDADQTIMIGVLTTKMEWKKNNLIYYVVGKK